MIFKYGLFFFVVNNMRDTFQDSNEQGMNANCNFNTDVFLEDYHNQNPQEEINKVKKF